MRDTAGDSHATTGAGGGGGAVPAPPPPAAPPFPAQGRAAAGAPAAPTAGAAPGATGAPSSWGWRAALAGLALGYGPQAALLLFSALAGAGRDVGEVTLGGAVALVAGSLVIYGWQTFAAWLFSLRRTGARLALWGFRRPHASVAWRVPAALAVVYAVAFLHQEVVHPRQQDLLTQFPRSGVGLGLLVLLAVVVAPPFEELFFRGFIYRGLAQSWGWRRAALVSGALFGLAHFQPDVAVPLGVLGVALAWVYERTGSLWSSIALHAVFNGLAVVAWAVTG